MLDQSFAPDNFQKIFDYENRKGKYLEKVFFPELLKITGQIKELTVEIRATYKNADQKNAYQFRKAMYEKRRLLKAQKDESVKRHFHEICQNIFSKSFKLSLTQNNNILEKPVYIQECRADVFFTLKQLQQNFSKLYKVKQSDRYSIISQVKNILNDGFPKYIIRTDIKSFYESIPHEGLKKKIDEESLLSFFSKRMISQLLKEYKIKSGSNKGLPRGIGISAYLSELYLRDLDKQIKSLPNVSYYARYVDDIIVIFTPTLLSHTQNYLKDVRDVIELEKFGLSINESKTFSFDLLNNKKHSVYCFDYLGYKFTFGYLFEYPIAVELNLSDKKCEKYRKRIDFALYDYINCKKVNEKHARKLLIQRIKFLTSNTRLRNNKKNILTGIYYSHSLLTNLNDLEGLDKYMEIIVDLLNLPPVVNARIKKNSFVMGFIDKRFIPFTTNSLHQIMAIWKRN